jgi:hypothetical protein
MKLESTGITHIYSTGVPMAKPDAIQYDKDGNEIAHWRFNPPAPNQEPYGYFRYDIKLDAWVQNRESTQGVAFYTSPSKREWVGLTMDEVYDIAANDEIDWPAGDHQTFASLIEAKLKEKNT